MITILALTFLTPSFRYIPEATLAAVLIAAVVFLIDVPVMVQLWKSSSEYIILTSPKLIITHCQGVS